nr:MAG TPA: hypothetical protein [Caudoviricetes sp.]
MEYGDIHLRRAILDQLALHEGRRVVHARQLRTDRVLEHVGPRLGAGIRSFDLLHVAGEAHGGSSPSSMDDSTLPTNHGRRGAVHYLNTEVHQ